MKKIIAVLLAGIMLFSFAACKDEKTSEDTNTTSSEENAPIRTDENLLTVTVTLSSAIFKDETPEEIQANAKENGIQKCTINDDGSVTYTMSKAKHKEMLQDMKNSIDKTINELIQNVASFVEIKPNDEHSQFDIYVNKAEYTVWDSMNAMAFYLVGVYYQCLLGTDINNIDVIVNFIDNETKDVIDTASYKAFAENMSAE